MHRVKTVAAYSLLARYWPAEGGGHHDTARVVGGFLARNGLGPETVRVHVEAIAKAANSARWKELCRTAEDAAKAFAAGKHAFGFNGLREAFGPDIAEKVAGWLDYKPEGERQKSPEQAGVTLDDFVAYMPAHSYIYTLTREMWPAASVNARIPPVLLVDADDKPILDDKGNNRQYLAANVWLDKNQPVEQMTWAPGEPMQIEGRLVANGGWIEREGVVCFNLYRPPTIKLGDAAAARLWLDHVHKVFENDADHIVVWLAHRVQRPQEKINHALVLGGLQGIGKDTLLEPVKYAVGPWNFNEVSPNQIAGRFNGFLKSVVLRVNEARDLGEGNRFQFYDHMKAYTAAPPDVLRVDEKHLREYPVFNVCGVIITTNHKSNGIYLPADDRRHYVAWSSYTKADFADDYWNRLWGWYAGGGIAHVAAYLTALDISAFDPKAPPPKTSAFWDIVNANRSPEDAELADAIDRLGRKDGEAIIRPEAITIEQIAAAADGETALWLRERKNRRLIPHRLESCGYEPVRNEVADDGLWKINERRQAVYARNDLPIETGLRR